MRANNALDTSNVSVCPRSTVRTPPQRSLFALKFRAVAVSQRMQTSTEFRADFPGNRRRHHPQTVLTSAVQSACRLGCFDGAAGGDRTNITMGCSRNGGQGLKAEQQTEMLGNSEVASKTVSLSRFEPNAQNVYSVSGYPLAIHQVKQLGDFENYLI